MAFWRRLALVFLLAQPAPALADAPTTSLRPVVRPDLGLQTAEPLRPRPRPQAAARARIAALSPAPATLLRPRQRPVAAPLPEAPKAGRQKSQRQKKRRGGALCGAPDIEGEVLARIRSNVRGCGIAEPVRVSQVAGVRLSPPATMDCDTAIALKSWLKKGMRPAFGNRKVVGLRIAADYVCRSRNNIRGNEVSEHGRGKAIDISGFLLEDGREWSVAQDYNRQMRRAHKAACGIFGTTLGPGSDGFHEDHLHFDTAKNRGGPYCR